MRALGSPAPVGPDARPRAGLILPEHLAESLADSGRAARAATGHGVDEGAGRSTGASTSPWRGTRTSRSSGGSSRSRARAACGPSKRCSGLGCRPSGRPPPQRDSPASRHGPRGAHQAPPHGPDPTQRENGPSSQPRSAASRRPSSIASSSRSSDDGPPASTQVWRSPSVSKVTSGPPSHPLDTGLPSAARSTRI
jgi:hypothetical protein